jgi:hypothetical protein
MHTHTKHRDKKHNIYPIMLGLVRAIFPCTTQTITIFFFAQFIVDSLHFQLTEFSLNRSCNYQSFLVYLLLFFKANRFSSLKLEIEDKAGNLVSVIHWTPVVRAKPNNVGFMEYVDTFMSVAYTLFHEECYPRISPQVKSLLHESSETKLGDWYLFQEYIEIRVYGAEICPFRLPKFFTLRIFSLEFIRQSLDSDNIHFIPRKKRTNFKIKREVGPFIVYNRTTLQVVETKLQELNLERGEAWKYDPFGIIKEKRLELGLTSYEHHNKPHIEIIMNLYSWEEVQGILQEKTQSVEQLSQTKNIETPQQQEKTLKINFLGEFQNVSESEDEHSSKKQKIEIIPEENSEENTQLEKEISEQIQKEPAYSMELLPTIFLHSVQSQEGEGSSETKPKNIFFAYDELKDKNLQIKQVLLPRLDPDPTKTRLLSALDFEKGKLNLSVLEPIRQDIMSPGNYKVENFSFDLENVPLVDKMELLKHTGEMVNKDVIKTTLSMKKLQRINNQLKEQLKQEQTLSRIKQIRVEYLEKKMLRIRDNSKDDEPMQQLISLKDKEIAILKNKLHMTDHDHVQTPELIAIQQEKEQLLKQIVQLNEKNKFLEQ